MDGTMDDCLDEYIATLKDCLALLRSLLDDIHAHKTRCDVVKTAGTMASVGGAILTTACIVAAPFTGGASIVGLTGLGLATSTAGAVTNVGTDVVDIIWTKKYRDELMIIDQRREADERKLKPFIEQIQIESEQIYSKTGDAEQSLEEALLIVKNYGEMGWQCKKALNMGKNVGRTAGGTLLRNGGKVWKNMRVSSGRLMNIFQKMGLNITGRAAFNMVKGVTVGLNIVFAAWDLASLDDALKNGHPAAEIVSKYMKNITDILEDLQDLRNIQA